MASSKYATRFKLSASMIVGRVAATNALSDRHAKGGKPRHAQAIVGLPELFPHEAEAELFQVLSGLRSILDPLGVSLLGGHTTIGDALTVGLSVSGDGPAEAELVRQTGARAGDVLLLTQPLGTGVILAADMRGLARGNWLIAAHDAMQHVNDVAGEITLRRGVHAATDVTGFGFAGHLLTLLSRDDLLAELDGLMRPRLTFPGSSTHKPRAVCCSQSHPRRSTASSMSSKQRVSRPYPESAESERTS